MATAAGPARPRSTRLRPGPGRALSGEGKGQGCSDASLRSQSSGSASGSDRVYGSHSPLLSAPQRRAVSSSRSERPHCGSSSAEITHARGTDTSSSPALTGRVTYRPRRPPRVSAATLPTKPPFEVTQRASACSGVLGVNEGAWTPRMRAPSGMRPSRSSSSQTSPPRRRLVHCGRNRQANHGRTESPIYPYTITTTNPSRSPKALKP